MVNFGYPYNDIVICKDSTDYLALKLRICDRFATTFNVDRVAVLTMTWSYVRIAVIV